jgi:hypothetical protein
MSKKIKLNKTLLKTICKERLEQTERKYKQELVELHRPIIQEYLVILEENMESAKKEAERLKVVLEEYLCFKNIYYEIETTPIKHQIPVFQWVKYYDLGYYDGELPGFPKSIILWHGGKKLREGYGTYLNKELKNISGGDFFLKLHEYNYKDNYPELTPSQNAVNNTTGILRGSDYNLDNFVDKVMIELALQKIDQENFDEVYRIIDEVIKK